jgi:hypothetical protein
MLYVGYYRGYREKFKNNIVRITYGSWQELKDEEFSVLFSTEDGF